jgi:hypothetical protein
MSEVTNLLKQLSNLCAVLFDAKLIAEHNDSALAIQLDEKITQLYDQMDQLSFKADSEFIDKADYLADKVHAINGALYVMVNDMKNGIDVLNNIASCLNYLQTVCEFIGVMML